MNKTKCIIVAMSLLCSAAIGRYTAPETIHVETKIETQIVKEEHVRTITVIKDSPDGTKETTITQEDDTTTHSDTESDIVKDVIINHDYLNISILAGAQPHLFQGASLGPIVYGASITRKVLGPITAGAWALSDASVGVSLGFNF